MTTNPRFRSIGAMALLLGLSAAGLAGCGDGAAGAADDGGPSTAQSETALGADATATGCRSSALTTEGAVAPSDDTLSATGDQVDDDPDVMDEPLQAAARILHSRGYRILKDRLGSGATFHASGGMIVKAREGTDADSAAEADIYYFGPAVSESDKSDGAEQAADYVRLIGDPWQVVAEGSYLALVSVGGQFAADVRDALCA